MDESAIKAYLYNKYPEFFTKWDNGTYVTPGDSYLTSATQDKKATLDGYVGWGELRICGGDLCGDFLVQDVHDLIREQRDRELLTRITWFKASKKEPGSEGGAMESYSSLLKTCVQKMNSGEWAPSAEFTGAMEDRMKLFKAFQGE